MYFSFALVKLKIIFCHLFVCPLLLQFLLLQFFIHFIFHCFFISFIFPQVEEAIEKRELPAYLEKSNVQIGELVQLVRTDLQAGVRIAVEALIVLDVHGKLTRIFFDCTENWPRLLCVGVCVCVYSTRCGQVSDGYAYNQHTGL